MKKYSIIFGVDEDKAGKPLSPSIVDLVYRKAIHAIANEYGGATLARNVGAWVNGEGVLVEERSFSIFTIDMQEKGTVGVHKVALYVKEALNQSSVLVTSEDVDGLLI